MKKYLILLILPTIIFAIWDKKWLDVNRWRCPFYNDGRYAYNDATGGSGASWPYPLLNYYIFGAGIWIGSISTDTFVTLSYNPNTAMSEMVPTLCQYWRQGYTNQLDRIYKYPGDWPAPLSRFPMAPQVSRANQDLWCCFSDSDPSRHTSPGQPLGIDVALTIYGFNDSIAQDFFYLKYDLMNNNNYSLNNVYFGVILDGDIGVFSNDDMVGLIRDRYFTVGYQTIRVKNTGFMYDFDDPSVVAIRFISATCGLSMTAFKKFAIDFDPLTDKNQYKTLAGYNYQTGAYEPFDSVDLVPGDKRVLLSSGPFNLAPLSSATFSYAVIAAPHNIPSDTTQLAWQSYLADSIFQARILGIQELPTVPDYKIANIYPNPFNSTLNIISSKIQQLNIEIYNINGTLVKNISDQSPLIWDGKDNKNNLLPAGIYFLKIQDNYNYIYNIYQVILLR